MAKTIQIQELPGHLNGLEIPTDAERQRIVDYLEGQFSYHFLDKERIEKKIDFPKMGIATNINGYKLPALKERLLSLVS